MAALTRVEELKQKFEENPRRYFAPLANELRKVGDLAQAIAICRAHLPNQPAHVSGHIVLAQALHEAGEIDESRATFAAAVELDPENLIALRYMGDIARGAGEYGEARSWYSRVMDSDPRNHEIARILRELESAPNDADVGDHAADTDAATAQLTADRRDEGPAVAGRGPGDAWSQSSFAPPAEATEHDAGEPSIDAEAALDAPEPAESSLEQASAARTESDAVARMAEHLSAAFAADDPESPSPAPSEALAGARGDEANDEAVDEAVAGTVDLPVDPSDLDGMWEGEAVSASALSDYEAAPEQWFDEGDASEAGTGSAGVAPAGEGRGPTPTAEIEALFDETEMRAHLRQQEAADPAPVARQDFADEVEAAFRDTPPARSLDAWSETPSLMALPALPEDPGESGKLPSWSAAHAESDPPVTDTSDTRPPEVGDVEAVPAPDPAVGRTPSFTEAVPENAAPFVTETLAELYLQQGFTAEALSIYRQLLARNPSDDTLRNRIATLEGGPDLEAAPPAPVARHIGNEMAAQSVRTFFGRLARRVPAGGSARRDSAPPRDTDRDAVTQPAALFTGPVPESDANAAQKLASAFTAEPVAPSGRPSRAAERDLSLDHLFRETPPPDAGPVTLDEFYAPPGPSPGGPPEGREPGEDERSADIRQFTSWLEGLKKK
jgi:tetratricopeptide (TPR) repeat protein